MKNFKSSFVIFIIYIKIAVEDAVLRRIVIIKKVAFFPAKGNGAATSMYRSGICWVHQGIFMKTWKFLIMVRQI